MNPPLGTLLALCSMDVAPIHRIRSVTGIIERVRLDQKKPPQLFHFDFELG
jgi:hypothetical protein